MRHTVSLSVVLFFLLPACGDDDLRPDAGLDATFVDSDVDSSDRDLSIFDSSPHGEVNVDDESFLFDGNVELLEPGSLPGSDSIYAAFLFDVSMERNSVFLAELDADTEPTGQIGLLYTTPGFELEAVFFGTADALGIDDSGDAEIVTAEGVVSNADGESHRVRLRAELGAGSSSFELDLAAGTAEVSGELGSSTTAQLRHLIDNFPEVDTIVFVDVPGSVNDEANMETGRALRAAGLNTHISDDGHAYSGGVDLFAAGVQRTVGTDPTLGVHSWSDGSVSADELPRDHPDHRPQIEYFTEMLGAVLGPDFYWFTIDSASADSIHEMTADETRRYGLLTE